MSHDDCDGRYGEPKPAQDFVTLEGTRVIVAPPPPPPPPPRPPPPSYPRVVIEPPPAAVRARDRAVREMHDKYAPYIASCLRVRRDVVPESKKDLQQKVLMILCEKLESGAPSGQVRAFLSTTIWTEIANHKRLWQPDIDHGADGRRVQSAAPSPEEMAERAEEHERLFRYLHELPPKDMDVILCVDIQGMTVDEAAEVLGRKRGSVSTALTRAREWLKERAGQSSPSPVLGRAF